MTCREYVSRYVYVLPAVHRGSSPCVGGVDTQSSAAGGHGGLGGGSTDELWLLSVSRRCCLRYQTHTPARHTHGLLRKNAFI